MTITGLHKKKFNDRLEVSEKYTLPLMELLKNRGRFASYQKTITEEDKEGVDYWVSVPSLQSIRSSVYKDEVELKNVPIQFKIRDKQKDIPVCRFQPFHGIDAESTVVGRDYRCLRDKKASQYYVAIRNNGCFSEIYSINSNDLLEHVSAVDKAWSECEKVGDQLPSSFFTKANTQLWLEKDIRNRCVFRNEIGDVWWKKNYNEKSPKFNIYINYQFKEWSINLTSEESQLIEESANG